MLVAKKQTFYLKLRLFSQKMRIQLKMIFICLEFWRKKLSVYYSFLVHSEAFFREDKGKVLCFHVKILEEKKNVFFFFAKIAQKIEYSFSQFNMEKSMICTYFFIHVACWSVKYLTIFTSILLSFHENRYFLSQK